MYAQLSLYIPVKLLQYSASEDIEHETVKKRMLKKKEEVKKMWVTFVA